MERTIDDVVETLKRAKDRKKGCTLLIGAGCSIKAGIPLASGFVECIKKEYPQAYRRAKNQTYPQCMAELSVGERRDLIGQYVDSAHVNWAHVGIAQLMKAGYVDRILTTNFDPLAIRACALVGVFPAVYDFAASQHFSPADIPEQAIFYLHGQRSGFVLMNTEKECNDHSELLIPVFEDAGRGRVWLVVGYSGENDPVFDHLAKVKRFDNRLYWVCYKDNEPGGHVKNKLLIEDKDACYLRGFDADGFFVTLSQKLGCFPPDFVKTPFSHLHNILGNLTPYLPAEDSDTDLFGSSRKLILSAIDRYEKDSTDVDLDDETTASSATTLKALDSVMAGEYDEAIAAVSSDKMALEPELAETVAWAHFMQGDQLSDQAEKKTGEEADRLWAQAYEKYEQALKIKPDKHEALNNWGNALFTQAEKKTGEEADHLWAQAYEKYEQALKIKPDMHEALNNWGSTICHQAEKKTGEEADRLWAQAYEKCEQALKIKPDIHEALNNGGLALLTQAKKKAGNEANQLYARSENLLLRAESVKTGSASYNLACLYSLQGNPEKCREWLENSRKYGHLPDRTHIENDDDLDSVRELEWFKEFTEL